MISVGRVGHFTRLCCSCGSLSPVPLNFIPSRTNTGQERRSFSFAVNSQRNNSFLSWEQDSFLSKKIRWFSSETEEVSEEEKKEPHPTELLKERYFAELNEKGFLSKKKRQKLNKILRPYPPPAEGVTVERFLWKIGKDCYEHAEAFEGDFHNLMTFTGEDLKKKEIPVKQRRWILHNQEKYRVGDLDIDPATDRQVHAGSQPPKEN